ncbi:hypothetical protein EWM64_g7235, partial [Hericium alpestre]
MKIELVDEGSPIPTVRRHRFQWNREYDELARDACVIVRARCRGGRKDWSALAQVFPGLLPNSVRQHFVQLTVGSETYLKRLEDRWYDLWLQHRGSEALPDPNPESPSDFDLAAHVEFLRRHIDKNALRVGFVSPQEMQNNLLPSNPAQIASSFDVIEKLPNAPTWDFMWSLNVDEGREKGMLQQAFIREEDDVPVISDHATDHVRTAEAALKMVFETPNENYDASAAAELLHDIGEQPVSVAQGNLLSRGVLSKLVRDPKKPKPGRTLKISEVNQNALGGPIASDTFQDAATLWTLCEEQEDTWREWPLLSTDGDTAALLQAVSDGKVNFTVDVSQPRAARALLDWNSKKADDDHIETTISVKFHDITALPEQSGLEPSPVQRDSAPGDHGKTMDDNAACCRESSEGVVDCEACLTAERASLTTRLNENDQRLGDLILARLQEAGSEGLTKMNLMEYLPGYTYDEIWTVVGKFLDSSIPLIHFTGYSYLVMVSASHIQPWTVIVSNEPLTRILPRRWLDIRGTKMADVWEAALRAVIGVIIFRPGIRQWHFVRIISNSYRWVSATGYCDMRVKQIWHYVPLPAKVKLLWARISASPLTLIYFGFSILHCILQVVFQVQAFMINANAASFLYTLVQEGNATVPGFFVLGQDELHYCADVPQGWSADSCELVWNGTTTAFAQSDTAAAFFATNTTSTSALASDSSSIAPSTSSVPVLTVTSSVSATSSKVVPTPKPQVTEIVVKFVTSSTVSGGHSADDTDDDDVRAVNLHRRAVQTDGQVGVALNGQGWNDKSVSLSETCLTALNWPVQELDNTKREDVTFIAFQVWVLGMSLVAILNESIPHIVASLLTHLSATGWGAFQIYNTASFHSNFKRLTTDGACDINLLPDYWTERGHAEIPALALNTAALFLSAFLS